MSDKVVEVNRAPVMTLWAAVVAERLGYGHDTALSLGKAVAGLNAQSKGRRLGIYSPSDKPKERKPRHETEELVELCGRAVPTAKTAHGVRAVAGDQVIHAGAVDGYLRRSFGKDLPAVRTAMENLASKFNPDELESSSYDLYEHFRPAIPPGKKGWGSKGELNLRRIRDLGRRSRD